MLLTEDEATKRLESPDNLANMFGGGSYSNSALTTSLQFKEQSRYKAYNPGGVSSKLTNEERAEAAARYIAGETTRDLAAEYGVNNKSIHAAAQSTKNVDMAELRGKNLDRIRDKAVDLLLQSFDHITSEKLEKASARDLTTMAGNLASVVERTSVKEEKQSNVQFILYCPDQKPEDKYKIVEV